MSNNNKYHIVHTESSGGWGGQEIRTLNEIREFIKEGHPVTLLCDANTPMSTRAKEYGIPTVELPMGKKTFKGLFAIRHWIANNDFDIINTHSSSDSWMVALGMRLTLKRKPLVRTRHVSAPVSNNRATRWLYQKASNHIVTTGEKLRETLIRDNNIAPDKVTSVPTGIDCDAFVPAKDKTAVRQQLGLPTNKIIIGIVATLRSWKGHQYLIDAFAQLDKPDTHLLIVGNGPQWDNIHQQIDRLNISDKVTLCGEQKDVIPWLQSMDIFVLPSYANEGVPQGLMQAMACGLPVISTDVGSITEIVKHGDTGFIVNQKSQASILDAIQFLLDHDDEKSRVAQQGTLHTRKTCSIKYMKKNMQEILSATIKRERK